MTYSSGKEITCLKRKLEQVSGVNVAARFSQAIQFVSKWHLFLMALVFVTRTTTY